MSSPFTAPNEGCKLCIGTQSLCVHVYVVKLCIHFEFCLSCIKSACVHLCRIMLTFILLLLWQVSPTTVADDVSGGFIHQHLKFVHAAFCMWVK